MSDPYRAHEEIEAREPDEKWHAGRSGAISWGMCFPTALRYFRAHIRDGATLVHAWTERHGPHAWVELDSERLVYDGVDDAWYGLEEYRASQIKLHAEKRYAPMDMLIAVKRFGEPGPWDKKVRAGFRAVRGRDAVTLHQR